MRSSNTEAGSWGTQGIYLIPVPTLPNVSCSPRRQSWREFKSLARVRREGADQEAPVRITDCGRGCWRGGYQSAVAHATAHAVRAQARGLQFSGNTQLPVPLRTTTDSDSSWELLGLTRHLPWSPPAPAQGLLFILKPDTGTLLPSLVWTTGNRTRDTWESCFASEKPWLNGD